MFTDLIYSPFDEIDSIFKALMENPKKDYKEPFPPINVYYTRNNEECYIEVALAGYDKKDIKVSVNGDSLILDVVPNKTTEQKNVKDGQYYKQRIRRDEFHRTYDLPKAFYDLEKADITFNNGILAITVPALTNKRKPVRVLEIK